MASGSKDVLSPDNSRGAVGQQQAHLHGQVQYHRGDRPRAKTHEQQQPHGCAEERLTGRLRSRRVSHTHRTSFLSLLFPVFSCAHARVWLILILAALAYTTAHVYIERERGTFNILSSIQCVCKARNNYESSRVCKVENTKRRKILCRGVIHASRRVEVECVGRGYERGKNAFNVALRINFALWS